MKARLLCRTGEFAGATYELGPSNTIGRATENEVVLASSLVSSRHARIYQDEGRWYLEDLGSLNGTSMDGMLLTEPTALERLHVITFAEKLDFIFVPAQAWSDSSNGEEFPGDEKTRIDLAPFGELPELEGEAAPPAVEAAGDERTRIDLAPFGELPELEGDASEAESEGETVQADLPELPTFLIVVRHDHGPPCTYELPEGRTVLGRGRDCDITVKDELLSRKHAQLLVESGEVVIEDLDSKNGTFVGEERLETAVLRPGQSFRLGPLTHVTLQKR